MVPQDKQVLLDRFLGQLPDHLAARLAKAVEVDRLIGGTDLPHDDLLEALRPQLRQEPRGSRLPTAQRLFCRPFEDLLVDAVPQTKQRGRISRVSILPVWHWLATELMPEQHKTLSDAISGAVLENRKEILHAKLKEFWDTAAIVLAAALDDENKKASVGRKLGSRVIADDAAEMPILLRAGTEIMVLQDQLPRPLPLLGERETTLLRKAYQGFVATQPDVAPYVALIAMARLDRPWEALHLAAVIAGRNTDTLISNTDLCIVGDLLFSDLDAYVAKIAAARPSQFDVDALLEALSAFAELSTGMVKELGLTRYGRWGQHLTKTRATVSDTMEAIVQRAPKEIRAALPAVRQGGFGRGPKPIDVSRPPSEEKLARALRYAKVLGQSKPFAVAAAFNAKLSWAIDEIGLTLRVLAEELLRELRTPKPGTHADEHLESVLQLAHYIIGEEETALLRRRARVPSRV